MRKKNLLYIITKLELGGAQKQLLALISGLDRNKYNIFLLTAKYGLLIPDALAIENLKVRGSAFLDRPINPLKDILALIEISRFIQKNKINLVHTHSSKAGIIGRLAAKLARVKTIIHTVHGWSFHDYQPRWLRWFYINLERLVAKFTDKIIVVSNFDLQKGLDNHIGQDDKYVLIRYGIDYVEFNEVDHFCHSEPRRPDRIFGGRGEESLRVREELGLAANDLVVGMVACFKPQKAPLDFIKLAYLVNKEMPGVKFILVGDGVLRAQVEQLINNFGLQKEVILLGWRRDIPHILSALDVFALTSLWEGLPISVLEVIVLGKPVVATNTGGIAEIISDGQTGFLVLPKDMDTMAKKIIMLLKDESLRLSIASKAKNYLDNSFSLVNMTGCTQNLYDSV